MSVMISDKYEILDRVAQGGMGIVFRARDLETGKIVAIKKILSRDNLHIACIRREVETLTYLRHPGIIKILDRGEESEGPWFAMEWIDGKPLSQWMQESNDVSKAQRRTRKKVISPDRLGFILNLIHRVASTLAFVHGEGSIHRDLSPRNIMLRPTGHPVLIDFGLRYFFGGSVYRDMLNELETPTGTLNYMAPELLAGEFFDSRADVYSLGCIFYELLTNLSPFEASSVRSRYYSMRAETVPALSDILSGIPNGLDDLVRRMIAFYPHERIAYAIEICQILEKSGIHGGFDEPEPAVRSFLHRSRFAAREPILTQVSSFLAKTMVGIGCVAFIAGEGGIGKTRCLNEISHHARRNGFLVFLDDSASLNNGRSPVSNQHFTGMLSGMRKILLSIYDLCRDRGTEFADSILGDSGKLLARFEPRLREVGDFANWDNIEENYGSGNVNPLTDLLSATLFKISDYQPLLLIIDDLHSADEQTLELIRHCLGSKRFKRKRFMILCAYRPEEARASLQSMYSHPDSQNIAIPPLEKSHLDIMIQDMLGGQSAPVHYVESLDSLSEGNPFFVSEYLQNCVERSILVNEIGGGWRLKPIFENDRTQQPLLNISFPEKLKKLLLNRLAFLSPVAGKIGTIAAVAGKETPVDILTALLTRNGIRDTHSIHELIERRILRTDSSGSYKFAHSLLQEAILDSIDSEEKKALHHTTGLELEAHFERFSSRNPWVLVNHFKEAGDDESAVPWLLKASLASGHLLQVENMKYYYDKALELRTKYTSYTNLLRIDAIMFEMKIHGNFEWVRSEYEVCASEGEKNGDVTGHAYALNGIGEACLLKGKVELGQDYFLQALVLFERCKHAAGIAFVQSNLAIVKSCQGHHAESIELNSAAADLFSRNRDPYMQGCCLINAGVDYVCLAQYEKAVETLKKVVSLFTEINYKNVDLTAALSRLGSAYGKLEEYSRAIACAEEAIALRGKIRDLPRAKGLVYLAEILLATGPLKRVKDLCEEGIKINDRFKDFSCFGKSYFVLGTAFWLDDDNIKAAQCLKKALKYYRRAQIASSAANCAMGLGVVLLETGHFVAARRAFHESYVFAEQIRHPEFLPEVHAQMAYLAFLTEKQKEKCEVLQKVEEAARDRPQIMKQLYVVIPLSRIYHSEGNAKAAKKLLAGAVAHYRKTGALASEAKIRREMVRLGLKKQGKTTPDPHGRHQSCAASQSGG